MSPLEIMKERRAAKQQELDELLAEPTAETRDLNEAESSRFDVLVEEIRKVDERIDQLAAQEQRAANAAAANLAAENIGEQKAEQRAKVTEPDIYEKSGPNSYFKDLFDLTTQRSVAAANRLQRHAAFVGESRALGNTNAAGGSGGEFAPPAWLVDEWINLIRPGRVTADLFRHEPVPPGQSSINYPKITGGTTTAVQSTQDTALSQTDMTTGYVSTGFATIGGKQVASQQILDQAGLNFDRVIISDLAADYGQRVGAQVFLGTGTGSGTNSVVNGLGSATIGSTQTWTQASPTPAGFYGQAGALLSAFLTKRLLPPNCWVMAPRRWYWLASATDGQGRPLVVPNGNAFNTMATQSDASAPAGMVGTFHGLPVYIDPQVPINLGAGTNQDNVYLLRTDDLVLFESAPQVETFREPYADSLGVLFRMYAYVGTILNRHPESIGVLSGTGLVTPTFAS